ncbi:MAG: hypothetical protein ACU0CI_08980 [Shimia sp.]
MRELVILIGAHAVGKMSVGQELEKRTGLKLFHNHVSIDVAAPYFSYSTDIGRRLVRRIREAFFEAFEADDGPGAILTFVWAFELQEERDYIEGIAARFAARGTRVSWVELVAPYDVRLARNETPNRLAHKPTKRDIAFSRANMVRAEAEHRLVSEPGEIAQDRYMRIVTTDVSPKEAARRIAAAFDL